MEDDPKTESSIREILGEYDLRMVSKLEALEDSIRETMPDLVIIDYDLKERDGLQVFRQIHPLIAKLNVIMLSAANNISLAVTATKLGVSDFLRKPIDARQLRLSVEINISRGEEVFIGPAEAEWLHGASEEIKKFYANVREVLSTHKNLILFGERGIEKESVIEFIHAQSLKRKRKLITLDLSSFRRENLEAHFWVTLQEIMAKPEVGSIQNEEERCGIIYLENVESLDENFKLSIFEFFRERKPKIDEKIIAIIGVYDRADIPAEKIKDYAQVEIPPLRKRKEDLPHLLGYYLKLYAAKYNKEVKSFSADLLDFLTVYDYPGNYKELERLIEQGVLLSSSEILELKDFPLDFEWILKVSVKRAFRAGRLSLEEARKEFEKNLYKSLLSKTGWDVAVAARFLDIPKTILTERLEILALI